MKCPKCKNVDLLLVDRNDVEIDYCPNCHGVWLDTGELDKVIKKEEQYDYEPKRKKETLLGEIFNFFEQE